MLDQHLVFLDLDTYKILTRFFSQPRGRYTVVELAA